MRLVLKVRADGSHLSEYTDVDIFGYTSKTSHWQVFKIQYKKSKKSGRCIAPAKLLHGRMTAFRTDADIEIPDSF